ncbi:riboflavin synthase [Croceiramulus getboli]|nr:riboflavin synthase [Flavobacteriaceae bacterium YJPT1-3]
MFTGIIETLGQIARIEQEEDNLHFYIDCDLARELKVDQSVAHNGVCLTVVDVNAKQYQVTAIAETLEKTNLGDWEPGQLVNLERAMVLGARLDGHLVQGHVDQTGRCIARQEQEGSWLFRFEYDASTGNQTIEKGSITVNGVSLTAVNSSHGQFSVAIIPYTYQHTTFQQLKVGDQVNLEFDVIGKYVQRYIRLLD